MSRKELIFDFIFTSIVRGFISILAVMMGIGVEYLGAVFNTGGLIFSLLIMVIYICNFICEAILTLYECKKVNLK